MAFDIYRIYAPFIESNELEEFLEWAFGHNFEMIIDADQMRSCWNTRHWHDLQLFWDHTISNHIEEMLKIWDEKKRGSRVHLEP